MNEDVDIHLKNINENKAFWKSCTENPDLLKEVNHTKESTWIPLIDVAEPEKRYQNDPTENDSAQKPNIDPTIQTRNSILDKEFSAPLLRSNSSLSHHSGYNNDISNVEPSYSEIKETQIP